jgi:hypothetical protein
MDVSCLETWQAARLSKQLFPCLNYLVRLKTRMEAQGTRLGEEWLMGVDGVDLVSLPCKCYSALDAPGSLPTIFRIAARAFWVTHSVGCASSSRN